MLHNNGGGYKRALSLIAKKSTMASPTSSNHSRKLSKLSPKRFATKSKSKEVTKGFNLEERIPMELLNEAAVHPSTVAVVAIDFGTTYSGYAYAFTQDSTSTVHMMEIPRYLGRGSQQPTALLLTEEGDFHSFGYEAQEYYHDMDEDDSKNWFYFEKFKMELHSREHLHEGMELVAANGETVLALTVFSHALRYFKYLCLRELSEISTTEIIADDIQWVITVPAIWRPSARQFMRRAATEAGLITTSEQRKLILALEPEAASVYCRNLQLKDCVYPSVASSAHSSLTPSPSTGAPRYSLSYSSTSSGSPGQHPLSNSSTPDTHPKLASTGQTLTKAAATMFPGVTYLVADCGGGTVDLTVHQIEENGQLKELCKTTGGAWGSIGVDCQFEMMLVSIFGESLIQDFINRHPVSWLELMKSFESKKRTFNPSRHHASNIPLPFSFIEHFRKRTRKTVEQAILAFGHEAVQWSSQGMLRLSTPAMIQLFEPVVNTIVKHIHRIISHPDVGTPDYLFLVGGFAESPVLQQAIQDAFSSSIKVIIPQEVSLSILKGAVLFGLDPSLVHLRRSVLTYGVGCLHKFDPGRHPPEKRVVKDGIEWCTEVFDTFVFSGQPIPHGHSITRCYNLARSGLQSTVITLFASEKDSVRFVTDSGVRKIGEVRLNMPTTARGRSQRELRMTMTFGDTEISVKAIDCASRETAFAQINFLYKE